MQTKQARRQDAANALVAEGMMTVKDTAAYLGVSIFAIYSMLDKGKLPWLQVGRSRRIPRRSVLDLVTANLHGPIIAEARSRW